VRSPRAVATHRRLTILPVQDSSAPLARRSQGKRKGGVLHRLESLMNTSLGRIPPSHPRPNAVCVVCFSTSSILFACLCTPGRLDFLEWNPPLHPLSARKTGSSYALVRRECLLPRRKWVFAGSWGFPPSHPRPNAVCVVCFSTSSILFACLCTPEWNPPLHPLSARKTGSSYALVRRECLLPRRKWEPPSHPRPNAVCVVCFSTSSILFACLCTPGRLDFWPPAPCEKSILSGIHLFTLSRRARQEARMR
jgi:hypothetical protein